MDPAKLLFPDGWFGGEGVQDPLFPSAAPPDLLIFSLFSPHP